MHKNETKSQELARFKLMAVYPNTIAALLNISERSVSQLRDQHEISTNAESKYPLIETVSAAFEHSRKSRGRGRPANSDDPENPLVAEQIRKVRAQADAQELKNDVTRRNLIPRSDVVEGMRGAFMHARARILALPKKVAPQVVGENSIQNIEGILEDHVREVCAELAETVVAALLADSSDDGGSDSGGDADVDSAA